jgi:hypothetical protein
MVEASNSTCQFLSLTILEMDLEVIVGKALNHFSINDETSQSWWFRQGSEFLSPQVKKL